MKGLGPDEIYNEILKLIKEIISSHLFVCSITIYDTRKMSGEWLVSNLIPMSKQTHSRKCSNFRAISLMSHALKILNTQQII